jgi:cytochrome P450
MSTAELRSARDPAALLLALSRRNGDIVPYRAGADRGYLVNAPEHIAHVLVGRADNYAKDTFSHRMFQRAVADGLLTFEGPQWRDERRTVEPAFRSGHVAAMDGAIASAVGRLTTRWDALAGSGEECDVAHEMSSLALDVTIGGLLGFELGVEVDDVGTAIARAVGLLTAPEHPRFVEARRTVHALVAQIIERRGAACDPRRDLLSILLETRDAAGPAVDDAVLRDRIVTFLLAGSQTTANALTWTLHLLAENPRERSRIEREVAARLGGRTPAVGDAPRLELTRMAVQESLRLYPTAWIIGRRAIGDDEIGGVTITSGTTVALSPYTMHRHPRYWERPDEFCPERFARAAAARRPRFTYFPFGAGPRICIGARLAMTEATVVVAAVTQRYRLSPVAGRDVVPEGRVLLRPRDGFWATIGRA